MTILFKGECNQCGCKFVDYDTNYSNGSIKLCPTCFKEYAKRNPVIIKHCPGSVENGGDEKFYDWKGLDQFLKDHPCLKDYHYVWGKGVIMIEKNIDDFWVFWHVPCDKIMNEVRKGLPKWRGEI